MTSVLKDCYGPSTFSFMNRGKPGYKYLQLRPSYRQTSPCRKAHVVQGSCKLIVGKPHAERCVVLRPSGTLPVTSTNPYEIPCCLPVMDVCHCLSRFFLDCMQVDVEFGPSSYIFILFRCCLVDLPNLPDRSESSPELDGEANKNITKCSEIWLVGADSTSLPLNCAQKCLSKPQATNCASHPVGILSCLLYAGRGACTCPLFYSQI